MKKNNTNLFINILTVIYIAVIFFVLCFVVVEVESPILAMQQSNLPTVLVLFILLFIAICVSIVCGIAFLPISIPLMIHYLRLVKDKQFIKKRYKSASELFKHKEDLDSYAMSHISYLTDFHINYRFDITATILNLIDEKIIIVDGKHLKVNRHIKLEDQLVSDQYILKLVKENKLKEIDLKYYTSLLKEEVIKEGYLKKGFNDIKERFNWVLITYSVIFIIFLLCIIGIRFVISIPEADGSYSALNIFLGRSCLFVATVDLIFAYIVFFSTINIFIFNKKYGYYRSIKGIKLLNNVYNLKQYMQEFQYLSIEETDALTTWNKYYIYTVLLGINKNEVMDFYKTYLK